MIYAGMDAAGDQYVHPRANAVGPPLFTHVPSGFDAPIRIFYSLPMLEQWKSRACSRRYGSTVPGCLLDKSSARFVINPFHTRLYGKGLRLRKTKTDHADAHTATPKSDVNRNAQTPLTQRGLLHEPLIV